MTPTEHHEGGADAAAADTVAARSQLLPEEQVVDSDDPHAQAEAVLAESVERTEGRTGIVPPEHDDAAENPQSAHRRSEDTAQL